MKGLERKCLIASAFSHGLLVALVFVGSAFVSRKPRVEAPAFELVSIPSILVDEPNVAGGGNPNVKETPQNVIQPAVPPSRPEPVAPVQETKPERIKPEEPPPKAPEETKPVETKPEPVKESRPEPKPKAIDPDAFNVEKAVRKPVQTKPDKPTFNFDKIEKKVIRGVKEGEKDSEADEKSRGSKDKQIAQARAGALSEALKRVQGGLSAVGEGIELPGPGGPAYASYELAIRKFYENAWIPPNAARGDEPVVEVEVVIARDGTILSQRITKKSWKRELDGSVQRTLDRVRKARVPSFPAGSTDEKRTFRINFNLTQKLSAG